jgi:hypothetical protein
VSEPTIIASGVKKALGYVRQYWAAVRELVSVVEQLAEAQRRIADLQKRVGELEGRLNRCPGEGCPHCGALAFRVVSSGFPGASAGSIMRNMKCEECGFEEQRLFDIRVGGRR